MLIDSDNSAAVVILSFHRRIRLSNVREQQQTGQLQPVFFIYFTVADCSYQSTLIGLY